jgi:hypothetical protein
MIWQVMICCTSHYTHIFADSFQAGAAIDAGFPGINKFGGNCFFSTVFLVLEVWGLRGYNS